ncbi:MAG TPA: hypothetical protein VII52_16540 [Gemmatimonadaceae bacterium]
MHHAGHARFVIIDIHGGSVRCRRNVDAASRIPTALLHLSAVSLGKAGRIDRILLTDMPSTPRLCRDHAHVARTARPIRRDIGRVDRRSAPSLGRTAMPARCTERFTHLPKIVAHLPIFVGHCAASIALGSPKLTLCSTSIGQRGGRPRWVPIDSVHPSTLFGGSMRTRQSLVLDTARHVQAFLDDNAALIGPSIASSRRNLDDVVTQLTTLAVTQTTSKIASEGATARPRDRIEVVPDLIGEPAIHDEVPVESQDE